MRAPEEYYDPPPSRSLEQRKEALARANAIRMYRANLKKNIKAEEANVQELLIDPPDDIETMKVIDLLLAMPRTGRVKVNRIFVACRISPSKTVGGLSQRQRTELLYILGRKR